MQEIAEQLDENTEALLDRWDGRPDLLIEDIYQIRDLEEKEISDLSLTDYQRKFVHAYFYGEASTTNVLKGRRTGYSFITCACILTEALTTPHGFFPITAPSKSQAKERVEDIYDLMDWSRLEFELEIDNRDEIQLSNGATIMAYSGNPDTSRGGDSADTLFIDEMAFLDDQQESMRAFSPFVALGDAQTVEISTPDRENDLFMKDHERGSEEGENGIISIYQPAFKNPTEIDETQSLFDQDVEPVMPYLDVGEAEKDRARDPKGFRQEWLCEPAEEEYRFYNEKSVVRAINRGDSHEYIYGESVGSQLDNKIVMAVDIAGGGKDDTAVVIVEHDGDKRNLRYHEAITDASLHAAGIEPAISRNPSAIAKRIKQLYQYNNVDYVITDATNIGEGFDSEIRQVIGRGVQSFNFSDKEAVAEMMGDLNYAFHNDLVTLVPDETLRDQILAIVKEQRSKGSKPRFSGKDYSPDGKDDLAIALALASYPPNMNSNVQKLRQKEESNIDEQVSGSVQEIELSGNASSENESGDGYRGAALRSGSSRPTGRNNSYKRRYNRR